MAPEIIEKKQYDYKADVWSLGALLYQLLIGHTPFQSTFKEELRNKLQLGNYSIPSEYQLSNCCIEFLDSCLQKESSQRLSCDELERLPFLRLSD